MDDEVPLRHARHPMALALRFFLVLDNAHNQILTYLENIIFQGGLKSAKDEIGSSRC